MTDTQEKTPDVHEIVLLLPWYVNGKLAEGERIEVERHLSNCPECRLELESLSEVRTQTRELLAAVPGPPDRVRKAVMDQIRRAPAAAGGVGEASRARLEPPGTAAAPGLLQRLAGASGVLFRPQWAPALAVLLIVGQFGALAWLAQRAAGPGPQPGGIVDRGVDTAPVRLSIVFGPSVSVREISGAIHDLGGRIVHFRVGVPICNPSKALGRAFHTIATRTLL